MSNLIRVILCAAAIFQLDSSYAQELQPAAFPDAQERSALPSDSTETINTGRGGFLGLGGQKPLQRVKGIPLPSRPQRYAANTAVGQGNAPFDSAPMATSRRSKTISGDLTTDFPARMIYLNGRNISSVRDQQLEGVNVRIDAHGNVYISAPHYEVQESTHYRPLLPNEVPRVSKPSVSNEAPLLPGRYSKSAPQQRPAVPPVESDDSSAEAEDAPSAGTNAAPPTANSPKIPAKAN
jgi:hypothetical protein